MQSSNIAEPSFGDSNPALSAEVFKNLDTQLEVPSNVPTPQNWKILIQQYEVPETSAGGIVLPDSVTNAQEMLNYMGRVVRFGPKAYTSDRLRERGDEAIVPSMGDWVIFAVQSGMRLRIAGKVYRLVNDTDILAKLPEGPVGYQVLV